ncbi:MAG: DNA-3-methyladenine glycosylase [Balneolaceae bacterium]|nr:DNA-3-methyladenine glycosylase [Balneolaceae bacterium]
MAEKLKRAFFTRPDVVQISRELLGKVLCTRLKDGELTTGIIVETEAYSGRNDRACHANDGRRTERTEVMYRRGGVAYIYLCYGIHHLFNVVTNENDKADAVLIRAVKPVDGISLMLERRGHDTLSPSLTAGPGRLTQALGIRTTEDGTDLTGNKIWIEDRGTDPAGEQITATKRVGVDYAGEHAERPWRFYLEESEWVSTK